MSAYRDRELVFMLAGVVALLVLATIIAIVLLRRTREGEHAARARDFADRTRSWWVMVLVFAAVLLGGRLGMIALFALISLLALREFLTLAPTKSSDHQVMAYTFFVFAPLQYALVAVKWYGLYSIMIPVYAFLLIPTVNAIVADSERFLERTATVQWGLMACVYALSYAPALLDLHIPGYEGQNIKLLVWLVLVVQMSDFLQYVFGKWIGRTPIAPRISPNKTWEGFLGGVASATFLGALLWWATPFSPLAAGAMALSATLLGFWGGLTMSAIKRDRGVKDYGTLLRGHGGMLDRVDSLCFAVPIFFHLTRFFYATRLDP